VAAARQELSTVLANKDSTPEQIKAKLEGYRTARNKAREDLKKAQDDLKGVLTARQEAVLVSNGTLE
jgi:Spy/CpxP family protein refolding chaperone